MVIRGISMALTELSKLHGSINTLKGHLTHTLDRVDKFLLDPVNKTTQDPMLSFQNEITKRHSMLEDAVLATSSISEEEHDVQGKALAKYEKLGHIDPDLAGQIANVFEPSGFQITSKCLHDHHCRFPKAWRSVSIQRAYASPVLVNAGARTDFCNWKEEFASFFAGYGMEYYPLDQQQVLFRKCISAEFWDEDGRTIHRNRRFLKPKL